MSQTIIKQPLESYTVGFEFAGKLPSGVTLTSGTVSAMNIGSGATDNTVLASTTATISGTQAVVKVQGGVNGQMYRVTFLLTLSNGDILEEDLEMQVYNL